jgi:hypothetical protein
MLVFEFGPLLQGADPCVKRQLEMPPGVAVSGLESDGGDRFFCGGGSSGKVRAIRRPRRGAAAADVGE